jgi:hypothetical protein
MHALETIVYLNERAVERCAHCGDCRQRLEAHQRFLTAYEAFNAETEAECLLCTDCVSELVECGQPLQRVRA